MPVFQLANSFVYLLVSSGSAWAGQLAPALFLLYANALNGKMTTFGNLLSGLESAAFCFTLSLSPQNRAFFQLGPSGPPCWLFGALRYLAYRSSLGLCHVLFCTSFTADFVILLVVSSPSFLSVFLFFLSRVSLGEPLPFSPVAACFALVFLWLAVLALSFLVFFGGACCVAGPLTSSSLWEAHWASSRRIAGCVCCAFRGFQGLPSWLPVGAPF